MNKFKLLTEEEKNLIIYSNDFKEFKDSVREKIIFDIEFKLSNEDYPQEIVALWQEEIKTLSNENVAFETVKELSYNWGYIIKTN